MDTTLREQSIEAEQHGERSRWLRRGTVAILLLAAFVWAADGAVSLLVQHSRLRAKITAQLEGAFGRPVEVGSYAFSVWGGPVLEAHSVRIGEDPRFGNEYFIRADSISVGLRWRGLLHGRISLGTLAVDGASLNLVRSSDGDWNLAEWLPKPLAATSSGTPASRAPSLQVTLRFRRVDISDSRIDFKRGEEKLAFALVDVNGSMETDAPGRWRINMTAAPWRAAVQTQRPGVIHVTGYIGGTSSRLRPAALEVSWTNASISDFFRLARGNDYGVRGDVAISLSARTDSNTSANGWLLNGKAQVSGLHRWDLAARPDNPSLNFIANDARLDPAFSELRVPDLRIEAPHSTALASAAFRWTGKPPLEKPTKGAANFVDVNSSRIDLADALAWVRAFHFGVPSATSVRGLVDIQGVLAGLPLSVASASVTGNRIELVSPGLKGAVHLGPIDLRYNQGTVSLQATKLTWGTANDGAASSFRIKTSPRGQGALFSTWDVAGGVADARSITALAAALGLNPSGGWSLQGPLSCDLRWQSGQLPWDSQPAGTISLGAEGAKLGEDVLRVPFLNLPIEQIRARIQLKPGSRRVAITSAKAFGTNWSGSFERESAGTDWQFALTADRITAADLDRWIDPRWRESFLDRMLPFLGPSATPAPPPDLHASGSLSVGEIDLDPFVLHHLTGALRVDGRNIELSDAKAQIYGGEATGLVRADLKAIPAYHAEIAASNVEATALAGATIGLAGLRAEAVEGDISIDAEGASRDDLISSIACRGNARARNLGLAGVNFEKLLDAPRGAEGGRIASATASFTCSHRAVQFQRLGLILRNGQSLMGAGSVGFDRRFDLRFQGLAAGPKSASSLRVSGSLSSPVLTSIAPTLRAR